MEQFKKIMLFFREFLKKSHKDAIIDPSEIDKTSVEKGKWG